MGASQVNEHRGYLADQARLRAFRQAIGDVVKPGDVVLDLGAGTGILGMLACRAGASRVYSIDAGGMIEAARRISRANGCHDRTVFIKGLSTEVTLPEQVDVVIADQLGPFAVEGGVLGFFRDAAKRFLKPGGVMIPSRVELYAAPVEAAKRWQEVEFWAGGPAGFDLEPFRTVAVNTRYCFEIEAEQVLGDPALLTSVDLATAGESPLRLAASVVASRAGVLHGIGCWFSAHLSAAAAISNSPRATPRIDREIDFLPIDRPVAVEAGDHVDLKLHVVPTDGTFTWIVEIWAAGDPTRPRSQATSKGRFVHSTAKAMLIAAEDLPKTLPTFVPRLSPRGQARQLVLSLCDGQHPVDEIERAVSRSHADLFRTPEQVAAFVASVVAHDAL